MEEEQSQNSVTSSLESKRLLTQASEHDGGIMGSLEMSSKPLKELPNIPEELSWPTASTKSRADELEMDVLARRTKIAAAMTTIIECLGEDPTREGLLRTPERFADAMLFLTQGYCTSVNCKQLQRY